MDKYAKIYIDELNKQAGLIDGIVRNAGKILPAAENFINGAGAGLGSMFRGYGRVFSDPNLGFMDKLKKSITGTFGLPYALAKEQYPKGFSAKQLGAITGTALPGLGILGSAANAVKGLLPDSKSSNTYNSIDSINSWSQDYFKRRHEGRIKTIQEAIQEAHRLISP